MASWLYLQLLFLVLALSIISLVDLRTQTIPDLAVLLLGLGGICFQGFSVSALSAVMSAAFYFSCFWLIRELHYLATGGIGLGFGDVKMAGAAGAWINALITSNLDIIGVAAIVAIIALFAISRHPASGRIFFDTLRSVPVLGTTIHKRAMTRYLQAVALLTGQGVPINQALELGVKACPIRNYHPALLEIRKKVVQGAAFVASLKAAKLLDESSRALLAVGEEANRLPEMLDRAAYLIERDTARQLERMLNILTPAITIIMGLLIGSLVISVMSAILSINDLAFK